jgi:hypothetical protein
MFDVHFFQSIPGKNNLALMGHGFRVRHPGLDPGLGLREVNEPGFVRPFSVIPAKAEPALDSIRGIHVHRNETAEMLPEGEEYLRCPSDLRSCHEITFTSNADCGCMS